jgi:hypothetical protein
MSGALKHWFDQVYYVAMDVMAGRPYGLWVHGQNDTTGAVKSVETLASALRMRKVAEPVCVVGEPTKHDLDALAELSAGVAANLG